MSKHQSPTGKSPTTSPRDTASRTSRFGEDAARPLRGAQSESGGRPDCSDTCSSAGAWRSVGDLAAEIVRRARR